MAERPKGDDMREIKFDLIYKGETRFHHKKYYLSELMCGINNICDIHHIMELVAERQYTGLKDKNGAEIYEGDLLHIEFPRYDSGFNTCVKWENGSYLAMQGDFHRLLSAWHPESICIIGNIYENPEMLEK